MKQIWEVMGNHFAIETMPIMTSNTNYAYGFRIGLSKNQLKNKSATKLCRCSITANGGKTGRNLSPL
jgi:hypothetical protein